MPFIVASSSDAEAAIAKRLIGSLQQQHRVLWLVCGGSNISAEVRIMNTLHSETPHQLANLTILLSDERFGPEGHPDSNYRQLREAGFETGNAQFTDVLKGSPTLEEAVVRYRQLLLSAFQQSSDSVAQLGMGPDGHIAGILPGSLATKQTTDAIVGYTAGPFVRMTLTKQSLLHIQTIIVLAYGDAKQDARRRLHHHNEQFETLPSSLLFEAHDASLYSD